MQKSKNNKSKGKIKQSILCTALPLYSLTVVTELECSRAARPADVGGIAVCVGLKHQSWRCGLPEPYRQHLRRNHLINAVLSATGTWRATKGSALLLLFCITHSPCLYSITHSQPFRTHLPTAVFTLLVVHNELPSRTETVRYSPVFVTLSCHWTNLVWACVSTVAEHINTRLHRHVVLVCIVMWGLSSSTVNALHQ